MPACSERMPALLPTTPTHLTRCYLAQKS
jgi:hypothetical protein